MLVYFGRKIIREELSGYRFLSCVIMNDRDVKLVVGKSQLTGACQVPSGYD